VVRVPLDADLDEYLRQEILPHAPDTWIDRGKTTIGYAISQAMFFRSTLDTRFVPLHVVADRSRAVRVGPIDGEDKRRRLRRQNLYSSDSADELPEVPENGPFMSLCTGGGVVGHASDWRLLPP
jgi:type I restriction enzyme M protein